MQHHKGTKMQISLQQAYNEACQIIGERMVQERLLTKIEAEPVEQSDKSDQIVLDQVVTT